MEEVQGRKVKGPDEKFCSECGEIIRVKAEICPKCGVRQIQNYHATKNTTTSDKKLLEKFLYSSGILFVIFLISVLLTTSSSKWGAGIIGSIFFALFSGVIAMAIPTVKKIIYLPISILIVLFIAIVIGSSMS